MEETEKYEFLVIPYNAGAEPYLHSYRSNPLNAKKQYDFLVYAYRGVATIEAWKVTTRTVRKLFVFEKDAQPPLHVPDVGSI